MTCRVSFCEVDELIAKHTKQRLSKTLANKIIPHTPWSSGGAVPPCNFTGLEFS